MFENFKLIINNFGPIKHADMDLSKINIITGPNASGKTTISKLIYCIVTSFSKDSEDYKCEILLNQIDRLINNIDTCSKTMQIDEIKRNLENHNKYDLKTLKDNYEKLKSIIIPMKFKNKELLLNLLETEIIVNLFSSDYFNQQLLTKLIRNEFNLKEQNLDNYKGAKLNFYMYEENNFIDYEITIENDIIIKENSKNITAADMEPIYIKQPHLAGFKTSLITESSKFHRILLEKKLNNTTSRIADFNYEKAIEFQNNVANIFRDKYNIKDFESSEFGQNENASSGLKSIIILELLLKKNCLKENSYLIIDEPESHLHPEWQLKLAEILVLLAKDFNVKLFINSYSPLFIEAMEVYSVKYGLKNQTRFYLTEKSENDGKFNVRKIRYDNLYELYNDLGDSYDIIDKVRGENLAKHF